MANFSSGYNSSEQRYPVPTSEPDYPVSNAHRKFALASPRIHDKTINVQCKDLIGSDTKWSTYLELRSDQCVEK
jgi:hypothetical protein